MASLDELKKLLRSLLTANPARMNMNELNREFKNTEGYFIPFQKYGFNSLEQMMYSIKDTVQVLGHGPGAEVRAVIAENTLLSEIDRLVSLQRSDMRKTSYKKPARSRRSCAKIVRSTPNQRQPFHFSPVSFEYQKKQSPECSTMMAKNAKQHFPDPPPLMKVKIERQDFSDLPPMKLRNEYNFSDPPAMKLTNAKQHFPDPPPLMKVKIERQDFSDHQPITVKNEKQYFSPMKLGNENNFSDRSTMKLKNENQHLSDPAPALIDLETFSQSSDSDTAYSIEEGLNDRLYFTDRASSDEEDTINYRVPFRIQENLAALIKEHPEGIWCAKLPDIYKERFNSEINYLKFGYTSLAQMCAYLSHIFHCIQPGLGDFKVFDKTKPVPKNDLKVPNKVPKTVQQPIVESDPALPFVDDLVYARLESLYPPDTVKLFEELPRVWVDEKVKEEDFLDIYVMEIYDPSKYWITFNTKECLFSLNNMMDEMQSFYSSHHNDLTIKYGKFLRVGLYCVAIYQNEYTRAIIVNTLDDSPGDVKVFYIDFGTLCKVKVQNIFFMHRKYFELPAQAVRSRLYGIVPPRKNSPWCSKSTEYFFRLTARRRIVARVRGIDHKNQILDLHLYDTNTEEDIDINQCLINENLAIPASQEQENYVPDVLPAVPNIYMYPTFEELEEAIYPNLDEMNILQRMGITHAVIFSKYYEVPNKSNIDSKEGSIETDSDTVIAESTSETCTEIEEKHVESSIDLTEEKVDFPVVTLPKATLKPPPPGFRCHPDDPNAPLIMPNYLKPDLKIPPPVPALNLNDFVQANQLQKNLLEMQLMQNSLCSNLSPHAVPFTPLNVPYMNIPQMCYNPIANYQNAFPCMNTVPNLNQLFHQCMTLNPNSGCNNLTGLPGTAPTTMFQTGSNISHEVQQNFGMPTQFIKSPHISSMKELPLNPAADDSMKNYIFKQELSDKWVVVIFLNGEFYVSAQEITSKFVGVDLSIVNIRKDLAFANSRLKITDLNLSDNQKLKTDLLRSQLIKEDAQFLHLIPTKVIPEFLNIISKSNVTLSNFDNFLQIQRRFQS